jgi:XTP/dITP diphosphohydrolase
VTAGTISESPRGHGGFGYDPVFVEPASGLTFAELPAAQKNALSHRARAWSQVFEYLRSHRLA